MLLGCCLDLHFIVDAVGTKQWHGDKLTHPHPHEIVHMPIIILMKMIAANYPRISLLLVTNVP